MNIADSTVTDFQKDGVVVLRGDSRLGRAAVARRVGGHGASQPAGALIPTQGWVGAVLPGPL